MNKDTNCLLCGYEGGMNAIGKSPRDYPVADIVVCKKCGHIQMYPLLSVAEEKEEYDNDASLRFGKIQLADGSDFESLRNKLSQWTIEHVNVYFDLLKGFENVLEIGAGYGFFMKELIERPDCDFNIEGIEIGKFPLDNFVGGVVHNINVLTDEIPDALCNKYDCIISLHVLEHISQPVLFLEKIKPMLKRGGCVVFEVPNINCFLGEISSAYKDFMYMKEHCSYFSADTLRLTFEKAGYMVDSITTYEIYSIENHCHWIREGTPYTKINQIYMPDPRLEWVNKIYKEDLSRQGKGFCLKIIASING